MSSSGEGKAGTNTLVRELWPVLVTARLVGATPLRLRTSASGLQHVELRLVSPQSLYFLLLSLTQLCAALWFCYRGLLVAHSRDSGTLMAAYLYLMGLLVPQLVPFLLALQSRDQVDFLHAWGAFQSGLERVLLLRSPLVLGVRRASYWFTGLLVVAGLLICSGGVLKTGGVPTLDDVLHVCGGAHTGLLVFAWYATCRALRSASARLLQELQARCSGGRKLALVEEDLNLSLVSLLELRDSWLRLCRLVVLLGRSVWLAQVFVLAFNFTLLLSMLYQLAGASDLSFISLLLVFVAACAVNITVVCSAGHQLHETLYRDLFTAIKLTREARINSKEKEMMLKFLIHMSRICPSVTFNGYIHVSRRLFAALFSALVTNLVVLLQLRLNQKALNFQEFINFGETLAS